MLAAACAVLLVSALSYSVVMPAVLTGEEAEVALQGQEPTRPSKGQPTGEAGGGGKGLRRDFERADTNGDGRISWSEAVRSMAAEGLERAEWEDLFRGVDSNGDRRIKWREYRGANSGQP